VKFAGDEEKVEMNTRLDERLDQRRDPDPQEKSLGELVKSLSEQSSQLVRDEIKLATAELKDKGKRAGLGAGMLGGAGVVALYGAGALTAASIMALGLAMADWIAAMIIAGLLFAVAGVLALVGKKKVTQAVPPAPEQAIEEFKTDIAVVKERAHR
jgi:predicted phage tail protein